MQPFPGAEEMKGKFAMCWEEGNMRIRVKVSYCIGRSLGNLVSDFIFPFLDDLCRLLICKIVMVYI